MAAKPKKPDLSALVILDSNALFTENDIEIVVKEFQDQLKDFDEFPVNFVVPKIVLHELMFRKLMLLKRLANEATHHILTVGKLTGENISCPPSVFTLTIRLRRRWKLWGVKHGVQFVKIPYNEINWPKVCSSAIHRTPPFSPFDPKGKSEKGFRDALLLETLAITIQKNKAKRIVFISNDSLLQQAATKRLQSKYFLIYKTTAEYLSYLKLENENFVNSLIAYIIEEAGKEFYGENNANCIYTRFNIPARIQSEFEARLSEKPNPGSTAFLIGLLPPTTYRDVTADGIQLGETNIRGFDKQSSVLLLSTTLRFGRAIQSSISYQPEEFRIAEFKIDWKASWDAEKTLVAALEVEKISIGNITFEPSTDDLCAAFNLPTLVQRMLNSLSLPAQQLGKT